MAACRVAGTDRGCTGVFSTAPCARGSSSPNLKSIVWFQAALVRQESKRTLSSNRSCHLQTDRTVAILWSQVSSVCFALETRTWEGAQYHESLLQRHDRLNKWLGDVV